MIIHCTDGNHRTYLVWSQTNWFYVAICGHCGQRFEDENYSKLIERLQAHVCGKEQSVCR